MRLNNLGLSIYNQNIQQTMINVLDKGDSVHIKGKGANETDLRIMLHTLKNSEKENEL